jgi:hypothetical protein
MTDPFRGLGDRDVCHLEFRDLDRMTYSGQFFERTSG